MALILFSSCQTRNNNGNMPTKIPTETPNIIIEVEEPIDSTAQSLIVNPMFERVDYNPAEFAVSLGTPFVFQITTVTGGNPTSEEHAALCIYYLDKDYLGTDYVEIDAYNLYGGRSFGGGINVDRELDGHQIFVSQDTNNLFFTRYVKDRNSYYRLYSKTDIENDEIGEKNYKITNINKFIEVKDNKIYYQDLNEEVFSFEMTTMEIESVLGYEVIDYSTLPDDAIDFTKSKILIYDEAYDTIDIYNSEIVDGEFILDRSQGFIDSVLVLKTGAFVDVKAADNYLFFTMKEDDNTVLYRFSMDTCKYLKLYETKKEFDASYATEKDYFVSFYDGNYNIEAIKYNFERQDTTLIYDGKTCLNWNHVANGETDDIVEEYRYADINYMVYKGNILFGFNIDADGVTTMVFMTDVIDKDSLPKPTEE